MVVFNTRQNRQLYNQLDMETPLPPISYSRFSSWHPKNGPSGCFPTSIAAAFAAPQAAQTDRVITGKKIHFLFSSLMLIINTNSCSSLPRKKKKKSNKTTGDCFKGSKTSLLIIDYIGSSLSRLARSSFSSCLGALLHRRVCFFFFFFFFKNG